MWEICKLYERNLYEELNLDTFREYMYIVPPKSLITYFFLIRGHRIINWPHYIICSLPELPLSLEEKYWENRRKLQSWCLHDELCMLHSWLVYHSLTFNIHLFSYKIHWIALFRSPNMLVHMGDVILEIINIVQWFWR